MDKTISVIIPVYNVAEYLPECLTSVITQSYHNLEIILINDGSTDRSGMICDEFACKDSRIRVIHQENGGAAAAKNAGLRVATGEYLSFVDSDDFLAPDAYEYMVSLLEKSRADVVQCAFRDVFADECKDRITENRIIAYSTEAYLLRFTTEWTCGLLWDKLYRRILFTGVFFEEGHRIDDEYFTYQGIMNAKQIVYSPQIVYNYRQRASSVMKDRAAQEQILLERLDYSEKRREKVVNRFPELKQQFEYAFLDSLLVWMYDSAATEETIKEIQRMLRRYFHENKPCKMPVSFRIKLLRASYKKLTVLIKGKRTAVANESLHQYFP